jgi:hypothetical protein
MAATILLTEPDGTDSAVTVDAATFLLSAAQIRRLRSREPDPPAPPPGSGARRWLRDLAGGRYYIAAHRDLGALFCNAMLFGGCVMGRRPARHSADAA